MTYSGYLGDSIGYANVALFRLNLLDGDLEARDTLCSSERRYSLTACLADLSRVLHMRTTTPTGDTILGVHKL